MNQQRKVNKSYFFLTLARGFACVMSGKKIVSGYNVQRLSQPTVVTEFLGNQMLLSWRYDFLLSPELCNLQRNH